MSLTHANKFSTYTIERLPNSHLLKVLGFRKGTQFKVQTKQPLSGPIVVKVGSRSIAIDHDIAKDILVREVVKS